jgi:oxygen-independent coproporphyrinogen-3 oxidase
VPARTAAAAQPPPQPAAACATAAVVPTAVPARTAAAAAQPQPQPAMVRAATAFAWAAVLAGLPARPHPVAGPPHRQLQDATSETTASETTANKAAAGGKPRPFGVYVHWPFCVSKCPYCDFNSHVRERPADQASYAAAIAREIAEAAAMAPGRTVSSVFFGGGTPSLMAPSTVGTVLAAIRAHWEVAADAEITLEANPGSVEAARFAGYAAAGVNRLSLGVQSLDDGALAALGRRHDAAAARRAIATARATFERVSCDLIYARPGQTAAAWRRELDDILSLAADHLSLYQLTIEPRTPFAALYAAGRLPIPDPDAAADLYELTGEVLAAYGFRAYEISNYARPGGECRHNLVYWRGDDYAGVGPGAHGRLTVGGSRIATATEKHPERWLDRVERHGHGLLERTPLTAEEAGDEFLVMGLRLDEGIDPAGYAARRGRPLDGAKIARLTDLGLLEWCAGPTGRRHLRVPSARRLVLNAIIAELAAETAS